MKAIKLSSVVLLLLSIIFSCTKTDISSTEDSSSVTARGGNGNLLPGGDVNPSLMISFNPDPGIVNQNVTVTGEFDVTTGVPVPDCGKLQLFQKIDGQWVKVADQNLSASIHQVDYNFVPTIVGDNVYEFCLHYVKGGCDGFSTTQSGTYYLDVVSPCVSQFTITPAISAVNVGGGLYEFTISYTLTSPEDVTGIKFQGGATAGGNVGHQITDLGNTVVVNANNNNTVLKWEGNLTACTPQVVTFKFTRNFSCPAANELITGAWSASVGATVLGFVNSIPYSCQ